MHEFVNLGKRCSFILGGVVRPLIIHVFAHPVISLRSFSWPVSLINLIHSSHMLGVSLTSRGRLFEGGSHVFCVVSESIHFFRYKAEGQQAEIRANIPFFVCASLRVCLCVCVVSDSWRPSTTLRSTWAAHQAGEHRIYTCFEAGVICIFLGEGGWGRGLRISLYFKR